MNHGVFPLVSGAIAQEKRLDLITSNIANAVTSGFKKDQIVFKVSVPSQELLPVNQIGPLFVSHRNGMPASAPIMDSYFVDSHENFTNYSPGVLKQTGRDLDLAIEGEGFFSVDTGEGVRYTRNGNFSINSDRQLITQEGFLVLGENGPITLNAGELTFGSGGGVFVEGVQAGQLKIVEFPNTESLRKSGNGLFMGEGESSAARFQIIPSTLELSNVNPILEIGQMIEVLRAYQAYQKGVQALNEIQTRAVNDIARIK